MNALRFSMHMSTSSGLTSSSKCAYNSTSITSAKSMPSMRAQSTYKGANKWSLPDFNTISNTTAKFKQFKLTLKLNQDTETHLDKFKTQRSCSTTKVIGDANVFKDETEVELAMQKGDNRVYSPKIASQENGSANPQE